MTNLKSFGWTQFFKDAGIPLALAKKYSAVFEDNRIAKDMLLDLNKDILSELGINAMGDVINILKHARKVHTQDVKRKEKESMISTTFPAPTSSNTGPPEPSPHSTTSGQAAAAVSTTSNATKKRVARKDAQSEVVEVAYIAYTEPSKEEIVVKPSQALRTAQVVSKISHLGGTNVQPAPILDESLQESYHTANYNAKQKVFGKMYSDGMRKEKGLQGAAQQQPRVIILPGEGRDMFTTTGLQKAAQVYESGEGREGSLATDRSRRLLESAGLIPSKVTGSGHSVFSRLDYKPSISSSSASLHPLSSSTPKLAIVTSSQKPGVPQRVIKLSNPLFSTDQLMISSGDISSTSLKKVMISKQVPSSTVTLYSDQLAATSTVPVKSRIISAKKTTLGGGGYHLYADQLASSSTPPAKKRVISLQKTPTATGLYSDQLPSTVTGKVPIKKRIISVSSPSRGAIGRVSSMMRTRQQATRLVSNVSTPTLSERLGRKVVPSTRSARATFGTKSRTGVFGFEEQANGDRGGGGGGKVRSRGGLLVMDTGSSMVADQYENQAKRQQSVRVRLQKGSFTGRLGTKNNIFRKLE